MIDVPRRSFTRSRWRFGVTGKVLENGERGFVGAARRIGSGSLTRSQVRRRTIEQQKRVERTSRIRFNESPTTYNSILL